MLQGGNSSNEINPANKPTGFNDDEIPVIDMPTDVLQPSDFIK